MKCAACGSPTLGADHVEPAECIAALRRDLEAVYGVVEHFSHMTEQVVARVEMVHPGDTKRLVFYITTGIATRDDVLAALIAANLKSAHVFGSLLRRRARPASPSGEAAAPKDSE